MATSDDKNFPVAGLARDGWSTEEEATATCYCGAVQLVFVRIVPYSVSHSVLQPLIGNKAHSRSRPDKPPRLSLRRLPQN
jgi:hypothetical protein